MGGLLQSLVDATLSRLGQTYLRGIYGDVHYTCSLTGRDLYYTSIELSDSTLADLGWWEDFLRLNPGNPSRSGSAGHLTVDWGDGSGTGTGTGVPAKLWTISNFYQCKPGWVRGLLMCTISLQTGESSEP